MAFNVCTKKFNILADNLEMVVFLKLYKIYNIFGDLQRLEIQTELNLVN